MFAEKIRPDAAETLRYFHEQGVTLKVISGDNPRTVAAVAQRVELPGADDGFDARELPEDQEALADVLEAHSVFGRVTPQQKRAMVGALQSRGHVVAMTGDGVNDALALKDADIGVAMGSGAAATRAVAQLVLLDGKFASMPGVVAEGRRVIANIERSANLFVTKTVYATLDRDRGRDRRVAVPVPASAPHVISTFTIGIPGFFLALAPELAALHPRVRRCGCCASPCPPGSSRPRAAFISYGIARYGHDLSVLEARTTATLVLIAVGLWVLVIQARPFNWWKTVLVAVDGRRGRADPGDRVAARLLRAAVPAARGPRRSEHRRCGRDRAARSRLAAQPRRRQPARRRAAAHRIGVARVRASPCVLNIQYSAPITTTIEPSANG